MTVVFFLRVDLNERSANRETPLLWAASGGHLELIKWWIASGREMDLGQHGDENTDAIDAAREEGHQEVISLLESFRDHPEETRLTVRSEIGWYDEIADRFAVVSSFSILARGVAFFLVVFM